MRKAPMLRVAVAGGALFVPEITGTRVFVFCGTDRSRSRVLGRYKVGIECWKIARITSHLGYREVRRGSVGQ